VWHGASDPHLDRRSVRWNRGRSSGCRAAHVPANPTPRPVTPSLAPGTGGWWRSLGRSVQAMLLRSSNVHGSKCGAGRRVHALSGGQRASGRAQRQLSKQIQCGFRVSQKAEEEREGTRCDMDGSLNILFSFHPKHIAKHPVGKPGDMLVSSSVANPPLPPVSANCRPYHPTRNDCFRFTS